MSSNSRVLLYRIRYSTCVHLAVVCVYIQSWSWNEFHRHPMSSANSANYTTMIKTEPTLYNAMFLHVPREPRCPTSSRISNQCLTCRCRDLEPRKHTMSQFAITLRIEHNWRTQNRFLRTCFTPVRPLYFHFLKQWDHTRVCRWASVCFKYSRPSKSCSKFRGQLRKLEIVIYVERAVCFCISNLETEVILIRFCFIYLQIGVLYRWYMPSCYQTLGQTKRIPTAYYSVFSKFERNSRDRRVHNYIRLFGLQHAMLK
jgi:hypothetical protein